MSSKEPAPSKHQAMLDLALLDPGAAYDTPEAVLDDERLTAEQKREILSRWEYDARELGVATEEGMPGAEESMLTRILAAMAQLNGKSRPSGPTKHRGHIG